MRFIPASEAVACVEGGQRVFVHGGCATPRLLVEALTARAPELRDLELTHIHTEGEAPYARAGLEASFRTNALFVGPNLREAVRAGRADYTPVFLSEVPALFRRGILPLDVALIHVSPPDRHGFCSLGVSVDVAVAAVGSARRVLAQVNPAMPRALGDGLVHVTRIHAFVDATGEAIPERLARAPTPTEQRIAHHVAGLVPDGATLQTGIGAIPDATLAALTGHRRLGIHTEMFSDGVMALVRAGAVTGEDKAIGRGRIVAGFVMGSRALYDFVDDNPVVQLRDVAYVNDTDIIRRNPRVTAINSAIEIDLTGQVCADSIGTYQYSGVGGQMDFIRGASLSPEGRPIIALPSTTSRGASRIVPLLQPGAGVVSTRAHVQYVVTEHGVANLYGRSLHERAKLLAGLAAPEHREALLKAARERFGPR
jgi:acyl-CoA hydrolase